MKNPTAIVISCANYRFQRRTHTYLKHHYRLNIVDTIALAGGTRNFVCPPDKKAGILAAEQLFVSLKLHYPRQLIFVDHQDCGSYSADNTIPSGLQRAADLAAHTIHFCTLSSYLKERYPDIKTRFFYEPLAGDMEEIVLR